MASPLQAMGQRPDTRSEGSLQEFVSRLNPNLRNYADASHYSPIDIDPEMWRRLYPNEFDPDFDERGQPPIHEALPPGPDPRDNQDAALGEQYPLGYDPVDFIRNQQDYTLDEQFPMVANPQEYVRDNSESSIGNDPYQPPQPYAPIAAPQTSVTQPTSQYSQAALDWGAENWDSSQYDSIEDFLRATESADPLKSLGQSGGTWNGGSISS